MGPPLRSFAADAHDCIVVWVPRPTGYKVVARLIAPASGLPSDRHSDRSKRAVALETARWAEPGWGEERTVKSNNETDETKKMHYSP